MQAWGRRMRATRGWGQARTLTSAKSPFGSIAMPIGLENWALVPTPSLKPLLLPASVVVSPLLRSIFRIRWLS